MNKRLVALVILVAGCGGAPFSIEDDSGWYPTEEAGLLADSGLFDGNVHDGGVHDGGSDSMDGSSLSDAVTDAHSETTGVNDAAPPVETGPTCTPFSTAVYNPGYSSGTQQWPVYAPGSFVLADKSISNCWVLSTPSACRCEETYTCACFVANESIGTVGCVNGSYPSCSGDWTTGIILTCP